MDEERALMQRRPEEIRWMPFLALSVEHAIMRAAPGTVAACGRRGSPRPRAAASRAGRCCMCATTVARWERERL